MNLVVIIMDLTGVALIFLALPVLVFPAFQAALSTTVPTSVDEDLADHVVICTHSPRAETLIAELESRCVAYVIVEPARGHATELYEDGYSVVHAEPDSAEGLTGANLTSARALVADISDEVDTSIVLTAKEIAEDVRVVSVVQEPDRATYHELAGADAVHTNSFGANRTRLRAKDLAERTRELNLAAGHLAREAIERQGIVLGSLGPTGHTPPPEGRADLYELEDRFAEQAEIPAAAGVDARPARSSRSVK
jgi:hypothetical protein